MVQCNEFVQQTGAISGYRLFGVLQFSCGFLLLFFATYVAMAIHGPVANGLPYYVCSLIVATMLVSSSYLAAIIYDRGQHVTLKDTKLLASVYFMMKVHFFVSMAAVVICVCSIILTGIYGVSEKCSYSINVSFNQGMAIFLLLLLTASEVLLVIIVIWFFKHCKYFITNVNDDTKDNIIGIRPNR